MSKLRALMSEEQRAAEDQLAADIKYHAARFVWRRQRELTPRGRMTWARWWEKKFGEGQTLNEYARKMADKKNDRARTE